MSENFCRATLMILPVAGAGLGLFGVIELTSDLQRHALDAPSAAQLGQARNCRAQLGDPALAAEGLLHRIEGQRLQPSSPSQSPAWWQQTQAAVERCLRDGLAAPSSG